MKRKFMFLLLAIAIFSVSFAVNAGAVGRLAARLETEYRSSNNRVMVLFKAYGDVNAALANIKSAMRTRDPGGFVNPYWIVSFDGDEVDKKTNCGVIIAQWYDSGFPHRGEWEAIMRPAIQQNAQTGTYFYNKDGGWRSTSDEEFKADALEKICL